MEWRVSSALVWIHSCHILLDCIWSVLIVLIRLWPSVSFCNSRIRSWVFFNEIHFLCTQVFASSQFLLKKMDDHQSCSVRDLSNLTFLNKSSLNESSGCCWYKSTSCLISIFSTLKILHNNKNTQYKKERHSCIQR